MLGLEHVIPCPVYAVLGIKLRALYMLGKQLSLCLRKTLERNEFRQTSQGKVRARALRELRKTSLADREQGRGM